MQWRWHLSRPISRTLAIGRLLKTAFTFGDWVPYAIWKMERHTGEPIELTDRQRQILAIDDPENDAVSFQPSVRSGFLK